jgi:hypothetical protein
MVASGERVVAILRWYIIYLLSIWFPDIAAGCWLLAGGYGVTGKRDG